MSNLNEYKITSNRAYIVVVFPHSSVRWEFSQEDFYDRRHMAFLGESGVEFAPTIPKAKVMKMVLSFIERHKYYNDKVVDETELHN